MITLYHSNQLKLLKTLLCREIKDKPLFNHLCPEIILAQSVNMIQWLKISLAQDFGISANIDFPSSENFIWDMLVRVLPLSPKKNTFSKSSMRWKMRTILPSLLLDKRFYMLYDYLSDDVNDQKLFQLTCCLVNLFEEYLMYHPDWIDKCGNGYYKEGSICDVQKWQIPLMIALMEYTRQVEEGGWDRISLFQHFFLILQHATQCPSSLPNRIFIFGLSTLPIYYIEALGKHIDIHIFFTNPCRYYWGNIQDYKTLLKLKNNHRYHYLDNREIPQFRNIKTTDFEFKKVGKQIINNPLLDSWGQLEKENLFIFTQMKIKEVCAFTDINPKNLLQTVQCDILELEDYSFLNCKKNKKKHRNEKRILSENDRSIEINLCGSMYHEVEVLQNYLLEIMMEDTTLTVRDIIVMAADINLYKPFIQAVFSSLDPHFSLPFYISDNHSIKKNPYIRVFHLLLRIPDILFTAQEVLSLLEFPVVAENFGIDKSGLDLLYRWVPKSGIRWGLDDNSIYDFDLSFPSQNTWKFGLTRMLLGYAMNSQEGVWNGILPFDESNGGLAELAGNLAEFIMLLKRWRKRLRKPRNLSDWLPIGRCIFDDFMSKNTDSEAESELINNHWNKVINNGIQALYYEIVPLARLREELDLDLQETYVRHSYLPDSINFCTLRPMSCIPMKVVCLLGMNAGVYPRSSFSLSIDLMHQNASAQKICKNYSNSEKYIFLDAFNSAEKNFYISYINRSIQDNTVRYPSILVSELLEYISNSFVLAQDIEKDIMCSSLLVKQHLQKLHNKIYPFSKNCSSIVQSCRSSVFQNYSAKNLNISLKCTEYNLSIKKEIKITLNILVQFWRHPIRSFYQLRLGVNIEKDHTILLDTEPFVVDGKMRYQIDNQLLQVIIDQKDSESLYAHYRALGVLPHGVWGELFWEERIAQMSQLANKLAPYYRPIENIDILVKINKFIEVTGCLTQVQINGLLRWRPGILNFQDGLILWLEHLLYCATGGQGVSLMLGLQNSMWRFLPLKMDKAKRYLLHYIKGYKLGISIPLLLTSSGGEWLKTCVDKKKYIIKYDEDTQNKAYRKLLKHWHGTNHKKGEKDDLFLQRFVLNLHSTNIKMMTIEAKKWLMPLLKYHQIE
ncbi:exodeoxyribonuclease V subunit gamma [Candidatus Erwinia haradaeae]|uniref:RecBCD enzyme subunit RecC n=1 Tax=Candidatus Erwinia haradaeae TaxID=1922217 RepID=A0A451D2S6_9GAMM|nr:exodeoxyribonuclease V subunit gamma [Candidatus Erwinia haradaeae]VFP79951.1 RecBCD enzyme subunit RecC [Candidatus Erwinia haradaeae]